MRKIVASLFISLDGVVEAPQSWHFDWVDDQLQEIISDSMRSTGALLLGRHTYQEFAAHWSTAQGPMAEHFNTITKYVVSDSLTTVDWQNSQLISLAGLKAAREGEGRDISVVGSATLVRSLLAADLLDELSLLVHPVVVGSGARLFPDGSTGRKLTTVSGTTLRSGVLHVVYRPA